MPSARERGTPSSLWSADLREAWESFWGGGWAWPGTRSAWCERTGPPPEHEHAGRSWGNAALEVKCLGCLPAAAAAANVRALEGRGHSAGENGRWEWSKGEPSAGLAAHCASPAGWATARPPATSPRREAKPTERSQFFFLFFFISLRSRGSHVVSSI